MSRHWPGGDAWLNKGANILLFGPSGSGKSHLAAALAHALVVNGYRVLFTRTTELVQRLQTARQALSLDAAIDKLDKYHLIILDDLGYVHRDQAETSVLFELIAARYERRSLLVTSNRPFGEWTSVFPDAAMTLAARRSPGPPRRHPGNERRELSTARRNQTVRSSTPPATASATPRKSSSQCLLRDLPGDTSLVAQRRLRHRPRAQQPDILAVADRTSKLSRYSSLRRGQKRYPPRASCETSAPRSPQRCSDAPNR